MTIYYRVYSGDNAGGAVDYTTPVANTTNTTVALSALPLSSVTRLAVRAYDSVSGQEELNVDAVVTISVDGSGNDVSGVPRAVQKVKATPGSGGDVWVDWSYPYLQTDRIPTGFHVYYGTAGSVSYASVRATVAFVAGQLHYRTKLTGLSAGTSYTCGVRAYNATGEETNTLASTATSKSAAPSNVQSLSGVATA